MRGINCTALWIKALYKCNPFTIACVQSLSFSALHSLFSVTAIIILKSMSSAADVMTAEMAVPELLSSSLFSKKSSAPFGDPSQHTLSHKEKLPCNALGSSGSKIKFGLNNITMQFGLHGCQFRFDW